MPTLSVKTKRGQSLDASKLHTCGVTRDREVLHISHMRHVSCNMRMFDTSTNITSLTCPDCQVKRQSCGRYQALSHLSTWAAKKQGRMIMNNHGPPPRQINWREEDSAPNLPSSAA